MRLVKFAASELLYYGDLLCEELCRACWEVADGRKAEWSRESRESGMIFRCLLCDKNQQQT